jgi:hypothetical protein
MRFLDAGALDDPQAGIKFDHLPVYGWEHEKLGHLDGFIVDMETGSVYYAAVHGGGWLHSRRFLVPIGHIIKLDLDKKELLVDVSKDAIRRYPEFDKDLFLEFTDEQMQRFERTLASACCPGDLPLEAVVWLHETVAHYREPAWWQPEYGDSATAACPQPGDLLNIEAGGGEHHLGDACEPGDRKHQAWQEKQLR